MIFVSYRSCLCPIHWSQMLSREWRCSWSSADKRCSNYIWVNNSFIAFSCATYVRGLTVYMYIYIYIPFMIWGTDSHLGGSWRQRFPMSFGTNNTHTVWGDFLLVIYVHQFISSWNYIWCMLLLCYQEHEIAFLCTDPWPFHCSEHLITWLQRRCNERHGVSNYQPYHCLLNGLFRRRSKKTSKLLVIDLCVRGTHRWQVHSPHKGPVTRKCFHLMTSSCVFTNANTKANTNTFSPCSNGISRLVRTLTVSTQR